MNAILFLILSFSSLFFTTRIDAFSDQEIRNSLRGASPRDAQLYLSWAYFSYRRSAGILETQELALKLFVESGKLLQNCTHTRRNPETKLPYPDFQGITCAARCHEAYAKQMATQATYVTMLTAILKHHAIVSPQLHESVLAIRKEARSLLAHTIGVVAHTTQQALTLLLLLTQKRTILDQVHELFDGVGISSFSLFDKKYTTISDYCFKIFVKSQELGNDLWHALETTRAQFYYQLFTRIYDIMIEMQFPKESFVAAFGAEGIVRSGQPLLITRAPLEITV